MLLQLGLLLPAVVLLALSLLTVIRVPVWVPWRVTVIAGEYGHILAVISGCWAVVVWVLGSGPVFGWSAVSLTLCGLAIVCFLRPVVSAVLVAKKLPRRMERVWGESKGENVVFSWTRLFGSRPPKVACDSHEYAPGLELDFRHALNRAGDAPCVIMIHGGGWDSGDRTEMDFFNDWLAQEGYAVAAVDYRLAPEYVWPAQRDDVMRTMQWLKDHAAELRIDPARFVLLGRSAGGQIASATAYTAQDTAIRGMISLYAPHDMPFVWSISRSDDALNSEKLMRQYMGGPPDTPERKERYQSASAQHHVLPDRTPPTLLMHGRIDTLVWCRHSERLAASLAEANRPHIHVELPWAAHAFEYNLWGPGGQLTRYAVRRFLAAVFSDNKEG